MRRTHIFTIGLLFLAFSATGPAPDFAAAQTPDLAEFLPEGVSYDPSVPEPKEVLGNEVGEWHVRHDQLVLYMKTLAGHSDRIRIEETGRTHENRPVLLLTVSSPQNLSRLEEIRSRHLEFSRPGSGAAVSDGDPVVVWLCYSVHGNEASGSNAALIAAYHLAAAQGPEIEALLESAIVLIDPALNPDGLDRFAHWVNANRGKVLVADSDTREHNEAWPSGRTNHYWFDLNRDWLPLVHPESRARVGTFQRWKPNVLTDFHEMGTNQTFFFQPGVPSRKHPLTPVENVRLTERIAAYHANALDNRRRLYYTEETFDDFYYGKGSTYPDANGAVGILFEQASARGHLQESVNGPLSFPFAVQNQFITTLSTLRAAVDLRRDLLEYQQAFYTGALRDAGGDPVRHYVFGTPADPAPSLEMVDLLLRHGIEVRELTARFREGGLDLGPGQGYAVPVVQPQYRLVKALFETRTAFADSLFYDVSSWTLPLAMGVPYAETGAAAAGDPLESVPTLTAPVLDTGGDPVAYAFSWSPTLAPRALYRLLSSGVRARVATEPFTALTSGGEVRFERGTIVVPTGIQEHAPGLVTALLGDAGRDNGVAVHTIPTGLTPQGIDLGSPSLRPLETPKPLLVVGGGVSGYESGEVWHLLDARYRIPVTLVETGRLGGVRLADYTHLLLVNGRYGSLDEETTAAVADWVRAGGVLLASKGAVDWVRETGLVEVRRVGDPEAGEDDKPPQEKKPERIPYARHERDSGSLEIGGAIFAADVDITHPIGYGYSRSRMAVFRNGDLFLEPAGNPYGTVVRYEDDPLWSGYCAAENLKKIAGSASVTAERLGRGAVILYADNPVFRGFWRGTNRLYLNGLFFGKVIERTGE